MGANIFFLPDSRCEVAWPEPLMPLICLFSLNNTRSDFLRIICFGSAVSLLCLRRKTSFISHTHSFNQRSFNTLFVTEFVLKLFFSLRNIAFIYLYISERRLRTPRKCLPDSMKIPPFSSLSLSSFASVHYPLLNFSPTRTLSTKMYSSVFLSIK